MKNEEKTCPQCGNEIPEGSPAGMCPQCLLAGAAAPTEVGAGPSADARPAPPTIDEVAAAFPQLEILDLIGQGGMGFVFRARQTILERDVALKILPQHLAEDPKFAERFTREGKLLAKLNHQNIVSIFDFGESGGFFYLMMEFVDGVNLRQAMRASRFTPEQALSIVPSICEALQFAHDEGVLHRDIKPENILLDSKGRVKIADFGIAKLVERGAKSCSSDEVEAAAESPGSVAPKEAASGGGPALREITQEGSSLGTPNYMAPEQIGSPSDVDHRADIYSLGVVFYELLTGELPSGDIAPPSSKTPLNPQVDEVVLRALEKERERRQSSATEFRTQVETVSQLGDAGYGEKPTFDLPSATDPDRPASTRSGLACALGAALFYTGLVCGYPLLGVFKLGQIALPLLLVVLFLSVTFCLHWGLGFGTATPTAEQSRRARSFFVPFSIIAAVLSLPVGGLGIFFLFALFEELFQTSSGWNPGLMEAVAVPLTILGTFLLPWSSWRLWREVRGTSASQDGIPEQCRSRHGQGESGQPVGNPWPRRVFLLIVAIICVPVGFLVIAVLIPMLAYQAAEAPTLEPESGLLEEVVSEAGTNGDPRLFEEYEVGKTFAELAIADSPETPEHSYAAFALAMMDDDPATAMRRFFMDVPTFPRGSVRVTVSEEERAKALSSEVLRTVIYRESLALVVYRQAEGYKNVVLGRRDGAWKIFSGADLPRTGSGTEVIGLFRAKSPDLYDAVQQLPAQPPASQLEETTKALAQGMGEVMSGMMNTAGQMVTSTMDQLQGQALNHPFSGFGGVVLPSRVPLAAARTAESPFVARLPQGEVELVALTRYPPSSETLWRADGSKSSVRIKPESVVTPERVGKGVVLVLREQIQGQNIETHYEFLPDSLDFSDRFAVELGEASSEESLTAVFLSQSDDDEKAGLNTFHVKVRVATGNWTPMASRKPNENMTASNGLPGRAFTLGSKPATESEGVTRFAFTHSALPGRDVRVTAVDFNGRLHTSDTQRTFENGLIRTEGAFRDLALASISEFRLEVRSALQVEFNNVSLNPGSLTEVEIVDYSDE